VTEYIVAFFGGPGHHSSST